MCFLFVNWKQKIKKKLKKSTKIAQTKINNFNFVSVRVMTHEAHEFMTDRLCSERAIFCRTSIVSAHMMTPHALADNSRNSAANPRIQNIVSSEMKWNENKTPGPGTTLWYGFSLASGTSAVSLKSDPSPSGIYSDQANSNFSMG